MSHISNRNLKFKSEDGFIQHHFFNKKSGGIYPAPILKNITTHHKDIQKGNNKYYQHNLSVKTGAGFTLIEILVVIGIIAILAAIVIIAINPAKQFAQARNTQRQAGINTILNAIGQHLADNKGVFAGGTPACPVGALATPTAREHIDIGITGTGVDLTCLVPTYVATMPTDPDTTYAVAPYTGYDVSVDATGRVTVYASKAAEPAIPGSAEISITR